MYIILEFNTSKKTNLSDIKKPYSIIQKNILFVFFQDIKQDTILFQLLILFYSS